MRLTTPFGAATSILSDALCLARDRTGPWRDRMSTGDRTGPSASTSDGAGLLKVPWSPSTFCWLLAARCTPTRRALSHPSVS